MPDPVCVFALPGCSIPHAQAIPLTFSFSVGGICRGSVPQILAGSRQRLQEGRCLGGQADALSTLEIGRATFQRRRGPRLPITQCHAAQEARIAARVRISLRIIFGGLPVTPSIDRIAVALVTATLKFVRCTVPLTCAKYQLETRTYDSLMLDRSSITRSTAALSPPACSEAPSRRTLCHDPYSRRPLQREHDARTHKQGEAIRLS